MVHFIASIYGRNKNFLSALSIITAYIWLYDTVIWGTVLEWYNNPDHSHGFIVPFIAGYFVYNKMELLRKSIKKPSNYGIIIINLGLLIYILGYLGAAYTTLRVSMLIVLAGIILSLAGLQFFRSILFPFIYLFFMIPVPRYLYDAIAFPLKILVTKNSVWFLQELGLPVLREGNIILLENLTLQVVDACSGIRSLTSLLAIGAAFAYIAHKNNFKRLAIVLLAIPVSIITNSGRIIITAILARYFGAQIAESFFHEIAGIVVLIGSVAILIFLGYLIKR